jgi:hypothetical protein
MRWLAAAFVTISLVAADFLAEALHFSAKSQNTWGAVDTAGLLVFVLLLAFVSDGSDD